MATSPALLNESASSNAPDQELLVAWQDPVSRRYHSVGVLRRSADGVFSYRYLTAHVPGFMPFLGFSDMRAVYTSPSLFPLFSERLLDESRPDRLTLYEALDLVATAGPMEFLARSGGRRAGDYIELLPMPSESPGPSSCTFLVHGVKYLEGANDWIDLLRPGQELGLEPDSENPVDERAVLVTADGTRLGWVPSPLLDYVRTIMRSGGWRLTVVRANPRDFGHHMRLLVKLEGMLPEHYRGSWRAAADVTTVD